MKQKLNYVISKRDNDEELDEELEENGEGKEKKVWMKMCWLHNFDHIK